MYFANNLKTLRTRHNLTQKQLADILDITDRAIRKYEAGESQPTLPVLKNISDYFKVSIDTLVSKGLSDNVDYAYIEVSPELYERINKVALKNNVTPEEVLTFIADKAIFDDELNSKINKQNLS